MSSYVKKRMFILQVRDISTLFERNTFATGVSACSVFPNPPFGSFLQFLRNCILHKSSWTFGMKDPLFGKLSSITQHTRWRSKKWARRSVVLIYIVLPPRCSVLPCAPLEVPAAQRERDLLRRAIPGRHRSDECFVQRRLTRVIYLVVFKDEARRLCLASSRCSSSAPRDSLALWLRRRRSDN